MSCNFSQDKVEPFLVRRNYRHCSGSVIMRPSGSHKAALGLLDISSFDSRINLSLTPLV